MKNGTGFKPRRDATKMVMGAIRMTVVTLSKNAESTAVITHSASISLTPSPPVQRAARIASA